MLKEFIKEYIDYKLLISVSLLLVFGLVSIYSATHTAGLKENFDKQVFWVIFGIIIMLGLMMIPIKYIDFFTYPAYILTLVILLATPFLGHTVYGSTSWFNLGSFKIQPAEFGKVTTVLCLAKYLSMKSVKISQMKYLAIAGAICFVPFGLIMLQPDFGTGTVYLFICLLMVFWAGAKVFYVYALVSTGLAILLAIISNFLLIALILVSIVILYYLKENWSIIFVFVGFQLAVGLSFDYFYDSLPAYQQKRISTFLNPSNDPLGAGYNSIQAKVAIGSGGLVGKGFLQGTQTQLKFIPKQWTDFIFCVPGEEFGFIGSILVLFLLFMVLWRGVGIASSMKSRYTSLVSIGIVAILLYHIFINIGMTMGLLPVMGLPLPFMSYGGSILFSGMIMVGILLNFYSKRKIES